MLHLAGNKKAESCLLGSTDLLRVQYFCYDLYKITGHRDPTGGLVQKWSTSQMKRQYVDANHVIRQRIARIASYPNDPRIAGVASYSNDPTEHTHSSIKTRTSAMYITPLSTLSLDSLDRSTSL